MISIAALVVQPPRRGPRRLWRRLRPCERGRLRVGRQPGRRANREATRARPQYGLREDEACCSVHDGSAQHCCRAKRLKSHALVRARRGSDQLRATLTGRGVTGCERDRRKHQPSVDVRTTQGGQLGTADERGGDGVTDPDRLRLRRDRAEWSRTWQRQRLALRCGCHEVHRDALRRAGSPHVLTRILSSAHAECVVRSATSELASGANQRVMAADRPAGDRRLERRLVAGRHSTHKINPRSLDSSCPRVLLPPREMFRTRTM